MANQARHAVRHCPEKPLAAKEPILFLPSLGDILVDAATAYGVPGGIFDQGTPGNNMTNFTVAPDDAVLHMAIPLAARQKSDRGIQHEMPLPRRQEFARIDVRRHLITVLKLR